MPARKTRSKAALQREQHKRNDTQRETKDNSVSNTLQYSLQKIQNTVTFSVVSGTLHQGDLRFQYPGIQCTFISFWALVLMESKPPHSWNTNDINHCIIDGNDNFLKHCSKLEIQPRQLLVTELPNSVNVHDGIVQLEQLDGDIKVGTMNQNKLESTTSPLCTTIEEAIISCFKHLNTCFLVCGGQTIAIAKRRNMFFVFDSHSRGKDGLLNHTGSAVLVYFTEILNLIRFIEKLFIESLRLRSSEQFELVPVSISKRNDNGEKETEAASVVATGPDTLPDMPSKELDISNLHDQVASDTMVSDLSYIQNQNVTKLHEQDMQFYFTDQKKRDTIHRQANVNYNPNVVNRTSRKEYMKTYMQKRRNDDSFRKESNVVSFKSHQKKRATEDGRQKYNEQATKSRDNSRNTEEGRQKLRKQSAERKKKMLSTEKGRQKHREQSFLTMKKMLSTEEGRRKHKEQSFQTMKKMLNTEEGRQKHKEQSFQTMKKMLSTEEGRQKHKKRSLETAKKMLGTEEGRQKHRVRSFEAMKKMISTEKGRQKHRERSAKGMKKITNTEEGRQKHAQSSARGMKRIRDTETGRLENRKRSKKAMRELRTNEEYLLTSTKRENKRKRKRRTDKEFNENEIMKKRQKRLDDLSDIKQRESFKKGKRRENRTYVENEHLLRKKRKLGFSFSDTITKFNEAICQSASYVCSCCQQVWFRESVKEVSAIDRISSVNSSLLKKCVTSHVSAADCEWICNTCIYNIKREKIPKLAVINGMKFPDRPPELNLNNLEERLISLRIPFMQIRALNSGGQLSLKGSVVNVPAEIEPTIRALPRLQNKSETIPVKLKRMKSMKNSVVTENVRPVAVMAALQTLLNSSELYREANISIDDKWNSENKTEPDIEDESLRYGESSDDESDTFSETGNDENLPLMTLLDEQSYDRNSVLSIAPGEGQRPLSIFKDPNAEYLAFPTIFCGQKRKENLDRHVPVCYSDICKWELRCVDRRAALDIPNIFYKMKKLQTEQVCNKVQLAVRRFKTKGKSYTAGYILKDNMGESLVKLDEGYKIFRTIRNSPQYWENQKKEVFAMIRQLGLPSLFISLSANDLHWPELIIALGKLVDHKDYTEAVASKTLSWETRTRLVQADPVTCVRHFDHRVSRFIETVLKSPESPLGILQDYFYRVEFQQRGSPHIHMLAWIDNSPKYNEATDAEVLNYIDQVSSCSAAVSREFKEYLDFQKHKHSRTCRKGGKPVCRFGIPFPPMRNTKILGPYVGENLPVYQDHYKRIQKYLTELQTDITFDDFLKEVRLSEDEYMKAIQTNLKTEKIFLKRKPFENRINPYMKDLLGVWKANHDIQFVLDAYACAMYIVSYINKSAKGMSQLMAEACKEARNGNKSLKESVRHIGNRFLNATEVSAQEAAYLILQLSMSAKSRKCEFLSTSPQSERTFLLKSKKELKALPEESTEIEADNCIKRYARRHEALEDFCLAEFVSKVVSVSNVKPRHGQECENDTKCNFDDFSDSNDEQDEMAKSQQDRADTFKLRYSIVKGSFRIVLRKKPKIIRYVHYSEKVHSENHYREQLMLFHPWRNEDTDLLNGYETFEAHFKSIEKEIQAKKIEYDASSVLLNEIETAVETGAIDNFDDICPNIESVEAIDGQEKPTASTSFAFYNPQCHDHAYHDLGPDIGLTSHIRSDAVEMIQNRLTESDYLKLLSSLNKKQREIFTHIVHSLSQKPDEQLCVFITGGAGVGKSVVIRILYQALHRLLCSDSGQSPENVKILLCAYTGLAAYNIQGSTLHNAFCIEPNKKLKYKQLSDDKRNTLITKYANLSVLIVDEVSMVGNEMLSFLYLRLQEIKCNKEPFGGIHVILVGDLFQLRPVGDAWIFANNRNEYASLAPNLWQTYFTMFELTEIMRQKDDAPFAQLLNRIREGKHTEEDLDLLKTRTIHSVNPNYQTLKNELHLFPCNAAVDAHNTNIYNSATTKKVEVKCFDAVLGEDTNKVKSYLLDQLRGKKTNDTGNLAEILYVAVGLCYDTTHNIAVNDGICNGTPCILKKIHCFGSENDPPSCLWVQFPDESIGRQTRKENYYYYKKYPQISHDWTPIWAVKRTFMFRRKAVVRQQFPLKASSAKTIHKAQGQTKSQVVVDMTTGSRPHQHYVAYSRVTSLQGLHLLNGLNSQIKVDNAVIQEMERLRRDSRLTLCYKPVSSNKCDLVTVFHNAQSLRLHMPLVQASDTFSDADVICLAETRLQKNDLDADYAIEGFHPIIRNDQLGKSSYMRAAHGLAVYVRKSHQVLNVHRISTKHFESLAVDVMNSHSSTNYSVIVIYKAPGCNFGDFKRHVMSLSQLRLSGKLIIVGDFNFNIQNHQNVNFLKVMNAAFPKTMQLKTGPTTKENTILDIAFTTCTNAHSYIITCVWSYHHALVTAVC